MKQVLTGTQTLHLEVSFIGDLGPAGLTDAIIESLENSGVVGEAGIALIKASSPADPRGALYVWTQENLEPEEEDPPETPAGGELEANL